MNQTRPAHLFISYLRDDVRDVERLCAELKQHNINVWLDRERIRPGERWQIAIRRAIENGAFFLACFSKAYSERERSYMNVELAIAVEQLALRPTDRAWFIPVLLAGGSVPDRPIGGGETLRDIQWVNLDPDWTTGVERIVAAVKPTNAEPRNKTIMVTDVTNLTNLLEDGDPTKFFHLMRQFSSLCAKAIQDHDGTPHSMLGDAMLATFSTSSQAVQCAITIQRDAPSVFGEVSEVGVRIGLAEGPIVEFSTEKAVGVVGATVNLASRICSVARRGQILVTDSVSKASVGIRFEALSAIPLKGIDHPIPILEVVWESAA